MMNFTLNKTILVVAAHPDDEMLGCAGTLARLTQNGSSITILLLGEGPTARLPSKNGGGYSLCKEASNSAMAAAKTIGINDVRFANLPDNRFDTISLLDIIQHIESIAEEIQPDIIFTHHAGDLNKDHCLTHQAVMTAFRPLPDAKHVAILGFEVLSSTEYSAPHTAPPFIPNIYVNIEDTLQVKILTLQAYASEMRPWPHPRSFEAVEHLAKLRGCHCGCNAAEAFILYRSITL